MSQPIRGVPGFRFEPSADQAGQRAQSHMNEVTGAVRRSGLGGAVLVTGLPNDTGGISNGITFTAGQTLDIPHNLGRRAQGFIVVDATGSAPQLYRVPAQPVDREDTFMRLTHAGASSTTVKLLVL